MAWNRLFQCLVADNAIAVNTQALIVSDLEMTFKITKSALFQKMAKAEITVFNANEDTRNKLSNSGQNILISAGYGDQGNGLQTIFAGNIMLAFDQHEGPTWATKIVATSIRSPTNTLASKKLALSYGANIPLGTIVGDIATTMGLVSHIDDRAFKIKKAGGFATHGRALDALQSICQMLEANQMGMFVDLNTIYVYSTTGPTRVPVIHLDYGSGLLRVEKVKSVEEQATARLAKATKKKQKPKELHERIKFETLLIPSLQPNAVVNLSVPEATGAYIIEEVTFEGDNFGGKWNCTVEAFQ